MIEPNELRRNNLAAHVNGEIVRIDGIPNKEEVAFELLDTIYVGSCELLNPITITPEWLERLGFYWSIYHQNFHYGDPAMMEFYDLTEAYPSGYQLCTFKRQQIIGNTGVFYVHQLQNLYFALTGSELKLTT